MCFIKENKQLYITNRNILVYKYTTNSNDNNYFISNYADFEYFKDNLYIKKELFFKFLKKQYLEKECFHSYINALGTIINTSKGYFLIPKGTLCYIDLRNNEIVSRKIIYLGNKKPENYKQLKTIKEDLNEINKFKAFFKNYF